MEIKIATSKDIEAIRRMADVVFRKTYEHILSPEQMDYMMQWMYSVESLEDQINGEGKYFFITIDGNGNYAGYVSIEKEGLTADGRPLFHLQKLYVMPGDQKTGLGKRLFKHALEHVSDLSPQGCRVELNVNRDNVAVDFYEKMGMVRDRQGDFPIGNDFYMNDYIYAIDLPGRGKC